MNEYVSCTPGVYIHKFNNKLVDEDELSTVVFGNCKIRDDIEDIQKIVIDELVLSEGTDIRRVNGLSIQDLTIFKDERLGDKCFIWYEVLKLLSGHKIYDEKYEKKLKYSRMIVLLEEGSSWYLVVELEVGGIVEKITELEFKNENIVEEFDMFRYSSLLFERYCMANDQINSMNQTVQSLRKTIKQNDDEKVILDRVLLKRDDDTRKIVITLLNEKKDKIRELSEKLRNYGDESIEIQSDSNYINRDIKSTVTELNSPGKRMRKAPNAKPIQSKKRLKLEEELKKEKDDDFDDFQFFGISPRKPTPTSNFSLNTASNPNTNADMETEFQNSIKLEEPANNSPDEYASIFIKPEVEPINTAAEQMESETEISTASNESDPTETE